MQAITSLSLSKQKLFVGYVFLAGLAALVDVTTLYLLTNFGHLFYWYSAAISYLVGMLVNFTLNKYLNFKNQSKKILRQGGLFFIVALVGLLLNQLIIYILTEGFGCWYMLSKFVSLVLVMFWSFWGHKNLTFKFIQ